MNDTLSMIPLINKTTRAGPCEIQPTMLNTRWLDKGFQVSCGVWVKAGKDQTLSSDSSLAPSSGPRSVLLEDMTETSPFGILSMS